MNLALPSHGSWPPDASRIAARHVELVIAAMTDPILMSYIGLEYTAWDYWLADLRKDALRPTVGLAFLGAVYGLAISGHVELCPEGNELAIQIGARNKLTPPGSLERELYAYLDSAGTAKLTKVLAVLLPHSELRSRTKATQWLLARGLVITSSDQGPEEVISALSLTAQLVALEAGIGLAEGGVSIPTEWVDDLTYEHLAECA